MPKKSDFFWLSWHFEIIKISLCEGHHIWESVNSNNEKPENLVSLCADEAHENSVSHC